MRRRKPKNYSPEMRTQILNEAESEPVRKVAARHGVHQSLIYSWRTIAARDAPNGHAAPVVVRSEALKARADANEARAIIRKLTDELDVLHRAFGKMVIEHPEVAQFFSRGKEGAG